MKKILILLALLFTITSRETYDQIINVWYNYEYSLLKYYADYNKYFFRAQIIPGNKFDVELKMDYHYTSNTKYFQVYIYEYENEPSDGEIMSNCPHAREQYPVNMYGDPYPEGDYYVLQYHYEKQDYYANYLGIIIEYFDTYTHEYLKFNYLAFRLNSNKYYFSNILDLSFNTHYELPVSQLDQSVIPPGYRVYVRSEIFSNDTVEIRLETKEKYSTTAFRVDVCQYKEKPVESQVYYGQGSVKCETDIGNDSKEDKKYVFPFKTELDVHHLSIIIFNQINPVTEGYARYLDIYIYSETGMAVAVLVIIIVLPCLVVIGVVAFLLKKFGCIGSK